MAKLPPSVAMLAVSPRWQFRGSGLKLASDVVVDGEPVARAELGALLRWTSLALRVSFNRHVELTLPRTDPRIAKAVLAVRAGHGHSGLLSAKSFRDGTVKCIGPFGSTQWVAAKAAAKRFEAFARALHAENAKDVTRAADARRRKRVTG